MSLQSHVAIAPSRLPLVIARIMVALGVLATLGCAVAQALEGGWFATGVLGAVALLGVAVAGLGRRASPVGASLLLTEGASFWSIGEEPVALCLHPDTTVWPGFAALRLVSEGIAAGRPRWVCVVETGAPEGWALRRALLWAARGGDRPVVPVDRPSH